MPRVRTRTRMERIFSARSRIPVSETTSFSKRALFHPPGNPAQHIFGPRRTERRNDVHHLDHVRLIFRSESSPMLTSQFFFGRNHRPSEQAPHIRGWGMVAPIE